MAIEIQRHYARGLYKGPKREIPVGSEFLLEIKSTKRMRDYTALVLEVLDSDVIGVSKVDISPGQKPVLQGVIVAARDEINDARVVSKLVRGRLPEHFVKDVITWRPDAEEKD